MNSRAPRKMLALCLSFLVLMIALPSGAAFCAPTTISTTFEVTGTNTSAFSDVSSSDWFYKDVVKARRLGLVAGVGGNMFMPKKAISYAEYITILVRILGFGGEPQHGGHWASGNIAKAMELGIVNNGEIGDVDAGIPREVMVKYTCRALGIEPDGGSEVIFEDTRNISAAERAYINAAYREYLTEGVGRDDSSKLQFGYGQPVTRAQLATMGLRIKAYKEDKETYKQSRAIARNAAEAEWKKQHNSGSSGSGSSGSTQQQQYIMWNGYRFPVGSVFLDMAKDAYASAGLDFSGAVRFIKYPERYDEIYNILTSKLDVPTVKRAIDYAKTKTNVEQELSVKEFVTPNGYKVTVYSVYGDCTVSFEVEAPRRPHSP